MLLKLKYIYSIVLIFAIDPTIAIASEARLDFSTTRSAYESSEIMEQALSKEDQARLKGSIALIAKRDSNWKSLIDGKTAFQIMQIARELEEALPTFDAANLQTLLRSKDSVLLRLSEEEAKKAEAAIIVILETYDEDKALNIIHLSTVQQVLERASQIKKSKGQK